MKNTILIILFFISLFVVNVVFYYSSNDYRKFLKHMKGSETQLYVSQPGKEGGISDGESKTIRYIGEENSGKDANNSSRKISEKEPVKNKLEQFQEKQQKGVIKKQAEVKLGKKYQIILDLFTRYDLSPIDLNNNLFDITNEYPDKYFEYYSRNLTLYFFHSKSYKSVLDIFNVLSLELPFSINPTNSFGEKSFYINLDKDIDDGYVRLVVINNGITFGLKVKKNEYKLVKQKLDTLVK